MLHSQQIASKSSGGHRMPLSYVLWWAVTAGLPQYWQIPQSRQITYAASFFHSGVWYAFGTCVWYIGLCTCWVWCPDLNARYANLHINAITMYRTSMNANTSQKIISLFSDLVNHVAICIKAAFGLTRFKDGLFCLTSMQPSIRVSKASRTSSGFLLYNEAYIF